jgi:hypothetical protein
MSSILASSDKDFYRQAAASLFRNMPTEPATIDLTSTPVNQHGPVPTSPPTTEPKTVVTKSPMPNISLKPTGTNNNASSNKKNQESTPAPSNKKTLEIKKSIQDFKVRRFIVINHLYILVKTKCLQFRSVWKTR